MRYFIVSYYQQANGKYNEDIRVEARIKNKQANTASLILDYKDRKIVKCRIDEGMERDFDKISGFYKNHYADIIMQLEALYPVISEKTFEGNNQTVMPIEQKDIDALEVPESAEVADDAE